MGQSDTLPKLSEKDWKIAELINKGNSVTDTAKVVGLSRTRTSLIVNRKLNKFKASEDFKLMKKVKLTMHKVVDDFNKGELTPDGKSFSIKASDALRVAEMVQDRIDPVVKSVAPEGGTVNFTQINVNNGYFGSQPVDDEAQDIVVIPESVSPPE